MRYIYPYGLLLILVITACGDKPVPSPPVDDGDLTDIVYAPKEYAVPELPTKFIKLESPKDNPLTEEGVELGRFLFYDEILSVDSTVSCSTCHLQKLSFTDGLAVSVGVNGAKGTRSAMSLLNAGLNYKGFFWNGRSKNLEEQAIDPVVNPVELHESWPNVEMKLQRSSFYPTMFRKAFGIENKKEITQDLATKALAQFQRTLLSYNSKYDRVQKGLDVFTEEEQRGFSMYVDDDVDIPDAQCDHCHTLPTGTSNDFFNNGLQEAATVEDFKVKGRGKVVKNPLLNGFFRAPTLRNAMLTAPYMHDGSIATMKEVIDHYASGGKHSPTKDPLLSDIHITEDDKKALLAFLHTLTDEVFLNEKAFSDPFDE